MSDYSSFSLEVDVNKQKTRRNERNKKHYALARKLGFNSNEARILMFKSEQIIRRIAEERKAGAV